VFAAFVLFLAFSGQGAQPAPLAVVAHLQYREVGFSPLAWEIKVEGGERFTKEPALSRAGVFRGRFCLGPDTNLFLPFAWDAAAHRLYLDLNRNRDLTDDPAGVFVGTGSGVQLYRGLRLEFPSPEGPYQVRVDAHVFDQGGTPRVFLYVRSLWEGAVELSGRKWYVAVIGKPDGRLEPAASLKEIDSRLILRPWAEKDKPFLWWHATQRYVESLSHVKLVTFPYRYAGDAEVLDAFNLPARLFFQDQAYHLRCRVEAGHGAPADLALSFEPVSVVLGRVRVEGGFIRRLVLDGCGSADPFTAVIDAPAGEVRAPVGVYARQIVRLQSDGGTNIAIGLGTNRLAVTETEPAVFNAGAPLRQMVEVGRADGDSVSLSYRLVNAAGLGFHLAFHDEKDPPRLAIRQGNKLVGEGRFEFG
jgi:hypothetical protein